MANIELVIKIPEEEYHNYLKMRPSYPKGVFCYIKAIQQGTPLPKGHGRLLDEKLIIENAVKGLNGIYDLTDMPDYIAGLPAIIPADKKEEYEIVDLGNGLYEKKKKAE